MAQRSITHQVVYPASAITIAPVITLEAADLDHRGMLVDFSDIKNTIQRWVDENLDHNMLLCREDPILPVLQARGERVYVMDRNPTAENISRLIAGKESRLGARK